MEPNKEAITKWIEALESEELRDRQVRGVMVTEDGKMCALGVRNFAYMRSRTYLSPTPVTLRDSIFSDMAKRWVGVNHADVIGETEDGTPFNVIQANDIHDMTFPEIAQYLRKKYL